MDARAAQLRRLHPELGPASPPSEGRTAAPAEDWRQQLAAAHALAAQDRLEDADAAFGRLLPELRPRLGPTHRDVLAATAAHAAALKARGKFAEALRARRELLDASREPTAAQDGDEHLVFGHVVWHTADLLWLSGQHGDAEAAAARAFDCVKPANRYEGWWPGDVWRAAALRAALGSDTDWSNPALLAQTWILANRAMFGIYNPLPPREELEAGWPRARFSLGRWDGLAPSQGKPPRVEPTAEGGIAEAKKVGPLSPGLYRLSLELPLRGRPPLRGETWVPICPWEVRRYPITDKWDRATWRDLLAHHTPIARTLPTLVMCQGLTLHPGPGGRDENFGVVATADLELPAGTYRLSLSSDDGACVWVDGQQVVNAWMARASRTEHRALRLAAGRHTFRVEFFNILWEFLLALELAPLAPADEGLTPEGKDPEIETLVQAVERSPSDANLRTMLGLRFAERGRYAEAADQFAQAMRLDPRYVLPIECSTTLHLKNADLEAYRRNAHELLKRSGEMKGLFDVQRVAYACLLAPDVVSGRDLEQACALAERGVELTRNDPEHFWAIMTLGWACYRRGDFAGAVKNLDDALGRTGEMEPQTLCCLFLAMAHHRLGHEQEAHAFLRRGVQLIDEDMPRSGNDPANPAFGFNWSNRIHADVVRREAEAVIARP